MKRPSSHWIIMSVAVVLCFLELGAYRFQGLSSVIASRAWALLGVAYFAATGMLIGRSLFSDLRKGKYIFALLVIGLGVMVFYRLGDIHHLQVNYESAQQLASFLESNIHKPDWGYTGNAFVGYPARQFIIVAIPSLLFGNKILWLQFGYAALFYSGALCFYLGVRHYLSGKGHDELWALGTVLSCFTFPYLILYLYNMEQIILPISFVMHALGWLLLSLEKLTAFKACILAWIAGVLGTSYTPDLAAWMLFQVFFLLIIVRSVRNGRRAQSVLWASVWAYTLTFGLCSFLTRLDVRLTSQPGHSREAFVIALKVFFLGEPQRYMPPVVAIFVAIFFLLALTGRLGIVKWITAGWLIGVIYFSATSAGYAPYDAVFTLYRSILLIPIMMLACWDTHLGLFRKLNPSKYLNVVLAAVLCLAAAAATFKTYFDRQKSYEPTAKDFLISFLLKRSEAMGIRRQHATFVSMTDQVTYHPIHGYGEYFFPLWRMLIHPVDRVNPVTPEPSEPLVIITDAKIEHKTLLPAAWTGTDEVTYLDNKRHRFPIRFGVYRYSP